MATLSIGYSSEPNWSSAANTGINTSVNAQPHPNREMSEASDARVIHDACGCSSPSRCVYAHDGKCDAAQHSMCRDVESAVCHSDIDREREEEGEDETCDDGRGMSTHHDEGSITRQYAYVCVHVWRHRTWTTRSMHTSCYCHYACMHAVLL